MSRPVRIDNDGPRLVATSYWSTEHAARGLLYVSINAGCVRVLVPEVAEHVLDEVPEVGVPVELRWEGDRVALVLLDDPRDPWVADIDARQVDRRPSPEDDGRLLALVWYRRGDGAEDVREVRRETVTIRRRPRR